MRVLGPPSLVVVALALTACQPPTGSDPCVSLETRPARIVAFQATGSASAATPVPIRAWVYLSGTEGGVETLQRESFRAKVQGQRIIVSGTVSATVQTGARGCVYPMSLALPKAEAVDLIVPLASGSYTVEAETPFSPPASLWEQGTIAALVPRPQPTLPLTVP